MNTLSQSILNQAPDFYNQIISWGILSSEIGLSICFGLLLIISIGLIYIYKKYKYDFESSCVGAAIVSLIIAILIMVNSYNLFEATYYPKSYVAEMLTHHE